ncbi:MAG: hypothetical protein C3F15_12875 [Holophagae bacterium]|nr:MAG: hypothetical protein C3F15_12875 [Holophagae bacterium]
MFLIILLIGSTLLAVPGVAGASQCYYPYVPRPLESSQQIREQLEADGLWHPNRTVGETPPPNPQVGDTWLWYIWDLSGYPTATLKPCTVRGMGPNSYIVVDDEEWNVSINQTDVDRILLYFEEQSLGQFPDLGIWELDTTHFGDPPNPLDGLPRIFLLYYRFDIASDGFFWVFDQFPDGTQPFASNEADVVYLATDSSGGGPSTDYMLGVAAHEFQHMIHYNYDTNEDTWVEEGLSELAMWLFGHPDAISGFNSNPDNSLTAWNAQWADYIKTYLWTLYAYEQYGGQPTIWDLVHTAANGMAGYLTALTGQGYTVTMEDVFGDWSVANFLDDTSVQSGQFGYEGDDLPPFVPFRTHSSYPDAGTGSAQNWATDYIRLTGFVGAPTLGFDGANDRDFRVSVMAIDPSLPTQVEWVPLDTANNGQIEFSAASGYAEVIVSVANVFPSTSASYSYTVGDAASSALPWEDGFESGDTAAWSATVP